MFEIFPSRKPAPADIQPHHLQKVGRATDEAKRAAMMAGGEHWHNDRKSGVLRVGRVGLHHMNIRGGETTFHAVKNHGDKSVKHRVILDDYGRRMLESTLTSPRGQIRRVTEDKPIVTGVAVSIAERIKRDAHSLKGSRHDNDRFQAALERQARMTARKSPQHARADRHLHAVA